MTFFERLEQRAVAINARSPVRVGLTEWDMDDGTLRAAVEQIIGRRIATPVLISKDRIASGEHGVDFANVQQALSAAVSRNTERTFSRGGSVAIAAAMAKLDFLETYISGKFLPSRDVAIYSRLINPDSPDRPFSSMYLGEVPNAVPIVSANYSLYKINGTRLELIQSDNRYFKGSLGITFVDLNKPIADIVSQMTAFCQFYALQGIPLRVAMVSYSTNNSGSGEAVRKVREVSAATRAAITDLLISDDCQLDAAVNREIAARKGSPFTEYQPTLLVYGNEVAARSAYEFMKWYFSGAQGMNGQVIACADMVSRVDPDVQTLRGIIESCRESYQALTGSTARIVSLADKGSQEKVVAASDSLCPHLILDSNMTGFPSSSNIYVLPDLLAANPLYKMMQWMTGTGGFYSMNARGFDLSRGDKPDDIVRVACYAVVTADMMRRQNRMPVSQDIFRLG